MTKAASSNTTKAASGNQTKATSTPAASGSSRAANYYLTEFRISTPFSPNKGINDGWHEDGHKGIDLAGLKPGQADGKNIPALVGGKVTTVFNGNKTAGNGVVIKGNDGREYRYIHMKYAPKLKVGDVVSAGQNLGQVGSTGRSSGPHLDLKVKDSKGNYIDPQKVLKNLAAGGGGAEGNGAFAANPRESGSFQLPQLSPFKPFSSSVRAAFQSRANELTSLGGSLRDDITNESGIGRSYLDWPSLSRDYGSRIRDRRENGYSPGSLTSSLSGLSEEEGGSTRRRSALREPFSALRRTTLSRRRPNIQLPDLSNIREMVASNVATNTASAASINTGSNGSGGGDVDLTNKSGYNNLWKTKKESGSSSNFKTFKNHLSQAIQKGVPQKDAALLTELIGRESTWTSKADNPSSTAYGYGQFLKGTRADYKKKYPNLNYDNPVDQVVLTHKYAIERYGSVEAALKFWDKNKWY